MNVTLRYGDGPQAIYDSLKSRIVSGELAAGDEIKIMSVAGEYGLSTVTVREAIRMLAADRLIELRPRRSPVVVRPNLAEILEINQVREALEPIALRAAVPRHDEESLSHCRKIIDQDRKSTGHWRKVELNRAFHLALLAPSEKPHLLKTIEEQYEGIARLAQYLVIDSTPVLGAPHIEHAEILEAVAQGDGKLAVKHLIAHIRASTDRIVALLDSQPEESTSRTG